MKNKLTKTELGFTKRKKRENNGILGTSVCGTSVV